MTPLQIEKSPAVISLATAGFRRVWRTPPGGLPFRMVSDRRALLRSARVRGVKLPVALLDAASPPVSGNRNADMVRANARAGRRDFLLGLAGCEGKNLIAQA